MERMVMKDIEGKAPQGKGRLSRMVKEFQL